MRRFAHTLLLLLGLVAMHATAQELTRGQVYQRFMKAEMLMRRGQDSLALAQLDTVVQLVPALPITYLRQARLYEQMYERRGDDAALNGAVFMYRKYLTMEFNEQRIAEPSARLRELETKMHVEHFEDQEAADSQSELAEEAGPAIITSDEELAEASSSDTAAEPLPSAAEGAVAEASAAVPAMSDNLRNFSFLAYYGATLPTTPVAKPSGGEQLSAEAMQGHWVSDLALTDGREVWIFDISMAGSQCVVTFSGESGVVNQPRPKFPFVKKALSYLRSSNYLSSTSYEVVSEQAMATLNGGIATFAFEVEAEYQPGKNLYKWSRNFLRNVSGMLPYGASIQNYLNNAIAQREQEDVARTSSTVYTFHCRALGQNVMSVTLSTLNKTTNKNGRQRTRAGKSQTLLLCRTQAGYSHYEDESDDTVAQNAADWTDLLVEVQQAAATDVRMLYPLAVMHQYGVGTPASDSRAVQYMQQLAATAQGTEARQWLANYYYNRAYNDETHSTGTRRKYLKSARYWTDKMRQQGEPWQGVMGDMMLSDYQTREVGTQLLDSAFYYYRQGAEAGDVYAQYRLGYLNLWANGRQDLKESELWLTKAAEAGQYDAMLELAHVCWVRNDWAGYLRYVNQAADRGCPEAYSDLSKAYLAPEGKFYGVERDFSRSCELRRLATRAEHDEWIVTLLRYGFSVAEP